jgi:hypothetical protein
MNRHRRNETPTVRPYLRRYVIHPHQNKERAFVEALTAAGYKRIVVGRRRDGAHFVYAKFALFDHDVGAVLGKQLALEEMHKRKIPVFMYPHAARPMVIWDGMYPIWPHTRCSFVIGEGHAEVMRRFGYPIPLEVVGWPLSPIKPFQPVEKVRNILFAPIHPGALKCEMDMEINRQAYKRLLKYCRDSGAQLTVRHIRDLDRSGLLPEPGVKYIKGQKDGCTRDIEKADLVVSHQTYAYMSVALGKPTLMMGEDVPPRSGDKYVSSWDKYKDIFMYPLDLLAVPSGQVGRLIEVAAHCDKPIAEWRERFIGKPFDGPGFIKRLECYL